METVIEASNSVSDEQHCRYIHIFVIQYGPVVDVLYSLWSKILSAQSETLRVLLSNHSPPSIMYKEKTISLSVELNTKFYR